MANLRIVFSSGTELSANDCGVVVPHVVAEYETVAAAITAAELALEEGALDRVCAFQEDILLMEWTDVVLDGIQIILNEEGVATLHLYMRGESARETTEEDLEKVAAYDILFGMEDDEEDEEEDEEAE